MQDFCEHVDLCQGTVQELEQVQCVETLVWHELLELALETVVAVASRKATLDRHVPSTIPSDGLSHRAREALILIGRDHGSVVR